jgi:hypothetical protein
MTHYVVLMMELKFHPGNYYTEHWYRKAHRPNQIPEISLPILESELLFHTFADHLKRERFEQRNPPTSFEEIFIYDVGRISYYIFNSKEEFERKAIYDRLV